MQSHSNPFSQPGNDQQFDELTGGQEVRRNQQEGEVASPDPFSADRESTMDDLFDIQHTGRASDLTLSARRGALFA